MVSQLHNQNAMIKFNIPYHIDNEDDQVTFSEGRSGSINGIYNDGSLTGTLQDNILYATYHNKKVNVVGLIEFSFHEKGFDAKWKSGLETGPLKGKWRGTLENSSYYNISIPNDVKVLLEQHLIKPSAGIDAVYNWFFGYYRNQFTGNETLSDIILLKNELSDKFDTIKQKNIRTIGIDFPIFLSKGKNRPVLMICAMDPLREESDDISKIDEIGYWVPFSIINSMESKYNKSSDRSNLSFFHAILETHDIYVTDIYKVFYREGQNVSNSQKEFKKLSVHKEIFENEIKSIKPHSILTLGNDARDAICQILDLNPPTWSDDIYTTKSKEDVNIIMVPHISGAARGAKAPILNNEFYKEIEGSDNLKYARIIQHVISSKL
jgi:hypothetical protein